MRLRRTLLLLTLTGALVPATAGAVPAGTLLGVGALPLPAGAVPAGVGGTGQDDSPPTVAVDDDGTWVAFSAQADGLVADAPLDTVNVYRRNVATGAVQLVSRASGATGAPAQQDGVAPRISDHGRYVAWSTTARLSPADTDDATDVYVRDTALNTTTLATPDAGTADTGTFDLSGDDGPGALVFVAYTRGPFATSQVWRTRVSTGAEVPVSVVTGTSTLGNGRASSPSIGDNGEWVAFASESTDLVGAPGSDTNADADVFAHRFTSGSAPTILISGHQGSSTVTGNGGSSVPVVAGGATGTTPSVAYASEADDLTSAASDGSNAQIGTYFKAGAGSSALISRANGLGGAPADEYSVPFGVDDGAGAVSFTSLSTVLDPAAAGGAVLYRRGTVTEQLTRISPASERVLSAATSGTGDTAVTLEPGSATGDDPDLPAVVVRDLAPGGATTDVSRPPGPGPALRAVAEVMPEAMDVSADGRYALFTSRSGLLPGAIAGRLGLYRRDLRTGEVVLVSRRDGAAGAMAVIDEGGSFTYSSARASISADGSRVAFATTLPLDAADGGSDLDVYVRDVGAGTTTLASRATDGTPGDGDSRDPQLSGDGRVVVFASDATALGGPAGIHVYRRDLAAGTTTLVDRAAAPGNGAARDPVVSDDGDLVAFTSAATNLDPADASALASVFVRDVAAGTTTLVSRRAGAGANSASGANYPAISGDGRVVAFSGYDPALAADAPGGFNEFIVVRDLATGANELGSRAAGGAGGAGTRAVLDRDGGVVAFMTSDPTFAAGRAQRTFAVVRDRATGTVDVSPDLGSATGNTQFGVRSIALSADGACVGLTGIGHTAGGAGADWLAEQLWARTAGCLPAPPAPATDGGGGGGTTPPGVPTGTPPKAAAPVLSAVSLSRSTFRVGAKRTATTAARKRAGTGTTVRFTLSTAATVTVALQRRAAGRRVGKACKAPTRKLRRRKACVRYAGAGTLTRGVPKAGKATIAFSGRVGRKALRPGRYRAVVRAANGAGRSKAVVLAFRVVRR